MRLAVMSDVHGNLPALEAVLNDLQQYETDGIIVAGDLVGGPQPIETIQLLRSHDCLMIRGNSDTDLLRYSAGEMPDGQHARHQFALLRWAHHHIDRETFDFIKSLSEKKTVAMPCTDPIRVVHGSPRNPSEPILPDREPEILDLALAQTSEPVLVCGHAHIPWKVQRNGQLAFNPGAVCGPFNGDVCAQYAVLTWHADHWQVKHCAVPYDLDSIRTAFRKRGLLEEGGALARVFLLCIETGHNIFEDFFTHTRKLAAEAGCKDFDAIPDGIWEYATMTFAWNKFGCK